MKYVLFILLLLPQIAVAEDVPPQQNSFWFITNTVLFFIVGLVGWHWLVTKPVTEKAEAQKKLLAELKKGDDVIVGGTIFGKVVSIKEEAVTVEIATNTKIRVLPIAVSKP